MNTKNILSIITTCILLAACSGGGRSDDETIESAVDSFVTAYFNYDFKKASHYCTQKSEKWLRFAASNVIAEDIDVLRSQKERASYKNKDINYISDSTATVRCEVRHFLKRDTLGRPGHIEKKEEFAFNLVRSGDKWVVDASTLNAVR